MMKELEVKLYGNVQGVGLRQRIKRLADELELVGYVQNLETGSVEILAQGAEEALEEFLAAVKKGTIHSKINDSKVIWHDRPQDTYTEFEIW